MWNIIRPCHKEEWKKKKEQERLQKQLQKDQISEDKERKQQVVQSIIVYYIERIEKFNCVSSTQNQENFQPVSVAKLTFQETRSRNLQCLDGFC